MNIPKELLYSKSHEWVRLDGNTAEIGLSDFAQQQLGDLVFVNMPQVGDIVSMGEPFADVESVKAVSDVFSPVSGTVCAVNDALLNTPELINESPYDSWFIKVEDITAKEDLLSPELYEEFAREEE
ncbi:MAG: glycine cleavage system protein GcvH [Hydrogenoanaerobacterium sp.]